MAQGDLGARTAILGSEPIGLRVLLALRATGGYVVYMTDRLEGRLRVARQRGVDWIGNPERSDVVVAIGEREPLGMDFVFECVGKQKTLDEAVELLKPEGTLPIVGIREVDSDRFRIHTLRREELRLLNVCRQDHCVAAAIELVARKLVNLDPLLTDHLPLAETKAALDLLSDHRDGVAKAIIHLHTDSRVAPLLALGIKILRGNRYHTAKRH